jgi:hypothetical protein
MFFFLLRLKLFILISFDFFIVLEMEDRDGKKPFIIPKTHTSSKGKKSKRVYLFYLFLFFSDVLITEKPDSRNVTELFNDIKSCALEAQFDFRQNECKSCDTIRNQKLQKLYK